MTTTRNERPMLEKVAFTMLPVKDMKRARAFYEKTLGLTVGSHSSNAIWTEYDLPRGGASRSSRRRARSRAGEGASPSRSLTSMH